MDPKAIIVLGLEASISVAVGLEKEKKFKEEIDQFLTGLIDESKGYSSDVEWSGNTIDGCVYSITVSGSANDTIAYIIKIQEYLQNK